MADTTTLAIALPAKVTMAEARATLAMLRERLDGTAAPQIDASALTELDSAAVAVLLECQRLAVVGGRTLTVTGAPPKLAQLAGLYGVAGLLGM